MFVTVDATNIKDLDERVVDMYKNVGLVLRKYRSGKVPKAFKVLPTLSNWEQVSLHSLVLMSTHQGIINYTRKET